MRTASLQLCLLSFISSLKGPAARFSILARIDKPIIKQGDKNPILDEVVISGYISEGVWLKTHTITPEYRWEIRRWEKFPIKATATLLDKAWEPSPVNAKPSTPTLPIQSFGEKLSFGFRISFVVGVLQNNPTATLTLYLEGSTLVNYCISDDSSKDDDAGNSVDYLQVNALGDQKRFFLCRLQSRTSPYPLQNKLCFSILRNCRPRFRCVYFMCFFRARLVLKYLKVASNVKIL